MKMISSKPRRMILCQLFKSEKSGNDNSSDIHANT
jgi:hypothetical protein